MEVPIEKLCKMFKCYDTDVASISLGKTGRRVLSTGGLHSKERNALAYLKMLPFVACIHLGGQVGQLCHLIHELQNNEYSFVAIADDVSIILATATIAYVVVTFGQYAPELNTICRQLGHFAHPDLGRVPTVEALDKLFDKYVRAIVYLFVSLGLITWAYYMWESCTRCAPNEVSACGFMLLPYLPYVDIYNKPWRQIWLTSQCGASFTAAIYILILVSQYTFLQEVVILHYAHLARIIQRLSVADPMERRALIGRIVRYHDLLIRINNQMRINLQKGYGLHLFVTPVNMSVIAYQLLHTGVIMISVMHICAYIFLVTLCCTGGERLSKYTGQLHHVIYTAIPLDDVKTAKMMQLILMRAEKPLVVSAGGITACNHLFLVNLYKTVWSTLMILNETN